MRMDSCMLGWRVSHLKWRLCDESINGSDKGIINSGSISNIVNNCGYMGRMDIKTINWIAHRIAPHPALCGP